MSPLIIDPVGSAKPKYQEKLKRDRSKAKKIYLPYYDREKGKWKVFEFPFFEIETLEYGIWEDHPVMETPDYPLPGMGTPGIGAGGTSPEGEDEEGKGPGPGSGYPGTPLYPPAGEGEGPWAGIVPIDPIHGEVKDEEVNIDDIADELELEMLKPTKKTEIVNIKFSSVSYSGPKSLLDWKLTIDAALERQEVWKKIIEKKLRELRKVKERLKVEKELGKISQNLYEIELTGIEYKIRNLEKIKEKLPIGREFKISIEREDERYRLPKVVVEEEKNALLLFIRDVSASITETHLEASRLLSKYIDAWVSKFYPKVERIYVAHNYDAWEETKEGYYSLQSGGGTRFASAYELILAMFEGKKYETRRKEGCRKINPADYDIYIVQMTDGFGQDNENEAEPLKKLMPVITRFCYLEEKIDYSESSGYMDYLIETFASEYSNGKLRVETLEDFSDEEIKKAMKTFFGKRK